MAFFKLGTQDFRGSEILLERIRSLTVEAPIVLKRTEEFETQGTEVTEKCRKND